jgi:hypothetical protein
MPTVIISAASLAAVTRGVADWKAAHPKAQIISEDAPYSHGIDIERGDWRVRIEYEEAANN